MCVKMPAMAKRALRQAMLPESVLKYFRAHGARGGAIAGQRMTADERKARALKASKAAAAARTKKAATTPRAMKPPRRT